MQILAAFLVVVFIVEVVKSHPSPPARCCTARRYTASLTDLRTVGQKKMALKFTALDFDQKVQVDIDQVFDTTTKQITNIGKTVFNYTENVMYDIPNADNSVCTPKPIGWPLMSNCVPMHAEYLGSAYLGLPGNLAYGAWRFPYIGTNANLTMAFTDNGCVPVVKSVVGTFDGPVDAVYLISSYIADNVDSSIFHLPSSCSASKSPRATP